MNEDIIRIALAQGWKTDGNGNWRQEPLNRWISEEYLPDPLQSHDDCHALIEWLNGRGWLVELVLNGEFAEVRFVWTKDSTIQHVAEFVPYREGLVKLTLKILDESDE